MSPNIVSKGIYQATSGCRHQPSHIAYQLHGTGTKCILLTLGHSGFLGFLLPQASFFAQHGYQVCIFEHRSIGHSNESDKSFTVMDMVLDTIEFLDHIGWKSNIHLVGISLGGVIAQLMASYDSQRFSSLCLTSTLMNIDSSTCNLNYNYFSTPDYFNMNIYVMFPKPWLNAPSNSDSNQTNLEVLAMSFIAMIYGETNGQEYQPEAKLKKFFIKKELEQIRDSKLPVLVCTGDEDILITPNNSKLIAKTLNVPLKVFKECGHFIGVQEADLYNKTLLDHFRTNTCEF
ncbi:Alpha/Beta hydrolase protein [Syncephalis fuscata]|nr:Alpha/Beta hydrolase protein [Syncephalis fuscata]